jgi:hypothetical protein
MERIEGSMTGKETGLLVFDVHIEVSLGALRR